jgi:hypothetical protein
MEYLVGGQQEQQKPYIIDENHVFYSLKNSPREIKKIPHTYSRDNSIMLPYVGDNLLEVYVTKGEFTLYFHGSNLEFKSTSSKVQLFEGGLPITGQSSAPYIKNIDPEADIYAVYELYDTSYRNRLASYSSTNDDIEGVHLLHPDTYKRYKVTGRLDPGHSVNTVVEY